VAPSEAFDRFYRSCFEDSFHAVHDGLDHDALQALNGLERAEMERCLLEALSADRDTYSRPVIALGYLRSTASISRLTARLAQASGVDRIETALALYRITGFREAGAEIVVALRATPVSEQWVRMRAVESLGEIDRSDLGLAALFDCLMDEDRFIRYLAADSLKRLFRDDRDLVMRFDEIQAAMTGTKGQDPALQVARQAKITETRRFIEERSVWMRGK